MIDIIKNNQIMIILELNYIGNLLIIFLINLFMMHAWLKTLIILLEKN